MNDSQREENEEPVENRTAKNRCAVCNQVVEGEVVFAAKRFCWVNQPMCKFLNIIRQHRIGLSEPKYWCRYHFTCSRCNVTLRGDKYNVLENSHYCIECFDFIRPRCDKCKKAIQTKQEYVKYDDDQVFHRECFLCYDCDQPLDPDAFVVEKNDFLCSQCSIDRHSDKKAKKGSKKADRKVKA